MKALLRVIKNDGSPSIVNKLTFTVGDDKFEVSGVHFNVPERKWEVGKRVWLKTWKGVYTIQKIEEFVAIISWKKDTHRTVVSLNDIRCYEDETYPDEVIDVLQIESNKKLGIGACVECDTSFVMTNKDQAFCSVYCRETYHQNSLIGVVLSTHKSNEY
jgi:hypothetical protein